MKIIKLSLEKNSYNIIIGNGIFGLLGPFISSLNIGRDAYVITNNFVKNKYQYLLNKTLKDSGFNIKFWLIPDSEKSKSLEMAYRTIKDIACYDKKRQIFIIAFGGGVIGDLAGFIASIYKRGIAYVQVPTTLLAQVDSSIGGKTAVDLLEAKNMVGAFYQPRLVFSDTKILKTLNLKQIQSGLAEVIKYAVIKDPRLFVYLEKNYKDITGLRMKPLEFIVKRCSKIKARIVEEDEREEKGIRTILNFGHTIGHAIEAAGNYKAYNHGESVSLGMLIACGISKRLGLMDNDAVSRRIENLIKIIGLPVKIDKVSIRDIIEKHYLDKKFIGSKNKFVLLSRIGKVRIIENVPIKIIKEALQERAQFP